MPRLGLRVTQSFFLGWFRYRLRNSINIRKLHRDNRKNGTGNKIARKNNVLDISNNGAYENWLRAIACGLRDIRCFQCNVQIVSCYRGLGNGLAFWLVIEFLGGIQRVDAGTHPASRNQQLKPINLYWILNNLLWQAVLQYCQ